MGPQGGRHSGFVSPMTPPPALRTIDRCPSKMARKKANDTIPADNERSPALLPTLHGFSA